MIGLKKNLPNSNIDLRKLIEPSYKDISIKRQCELLGIARSSYYYTPQKESKENLLYMNLMDEQYLKTPFYGVRQMTYFLQKRGYPVNIKRVRRLYKKMCLRAICPGPHRKKKGDGTSHKVYPYLLNGLGISKVGQVVSTDITYVPMQNGFLYLVAFIDWYSRYVLCWELSKSLENTFCVSTLEKTLSLLNIEIINTDQGRQFTSNDFVNTILNHESNVKISMDGKGRAIDNVFIERFWRSFKYEEVYLKSYKCGHEAWQGINDYVHFYNNERSHSSLDGNVPYEVFTGLKSAEPIQW